MRKPAAACLLLVLFILWMHSTAMASTPILIAHRGASGDRPEHTLGAYQRAIEMGADYIEPDLVLTKDGVLVARHENEISETTDVATRAEFATRKISKKIDGETMTGWFTEDFTLAELKTLRAKERLPQLRPDNRRFDGQESVPSFDEIMALLDDHAAKTGKRIGVYPETKHPSYFTAIGLSHEGPLLTVLGKFGYDSKDDPVFIQSFEVGNLQALSDKTDVRLIQLIAAQGGPADRPETNYEAMITQAGLRMIAAYANGIGPQKDLVIPRLSDGTLGKPTALVNDAHKAGLKVHPWTFRAENYFLPAGMKIGDSPIAEGDLAAEIRAFVKAGVDGLFSDHSDLARAAIN